LRLNVIIFILFCVFNFFKLNAQTYNYSYSDPCSGNIKTIVVPINGNVTVSYYGSIGSFSQNDFTNGTFESWTNNIFSQYGTNSPCSEIVGLGTAINVTQGTALNVIGILNSLSSISDLASGSTNLIGGSVTTINNTGGNNNSKNNKRGNNSQNGSGNNTNTNNSTTNNTQTQTNGTGNSTQGGTTTSGSNEGTTNGGNGATSQNAGTQNPTQTGGTTTQGGSNENGNTSSNTTVNGETPNNPTQTTGGETSETPINNQTTTENGSNSSNPSIPNNGGNGGNGSNGSGSGNNQTQENQTTTEGTEEGGQTNITGGATTTVKATPTSKEGGKPTIVASGDFVGFNFRNSEVNTGLKVTGGYTAMRWDGKRSSGVLGDYTSALRGPNITAFYAFIRSKSIVIGSGTLTIGFEGNKSLYGTIAVGQMFSFKKPKSLKLLYMGTVSYGQVYRESFLGTALIAGATYDMRIGKRLDIKLMNLLVYAPYVSYYNDVVLKSPYVMLPSIGTNIKITKKFKFNINAGGAWDLKTSALNYTVTCGARMLVGQ
jgi:hypothetical protein